jgi:K+-sensing histidine kinase KdpD
MITIRDVTKLLQVKNIENENKFFNQLTATVTHEMMIPLNCIITFARSIAKQNSDQIAKANTIANVAVLLKMNLKDLLDRSLFQNGKLQPNFEESSLYDMVTEVVMIM